MRIQLRGFLVVQIMEACGFFYWYDPPICPRGRQVLPKLVDKVSNLEEMVTEIARLKEDVQTYRRRQKWITYSTSSLLMVAAGVDFLLVDALCGGYCCCPCCPPVDVSPDIASDLNPMKVCRVLTY
ncbi:hypothetical protein TEA_000743 [Camellia sinensis var. sinensis]|uniref:Uncharacterized protein n=1 Tax=Camellia sinensis var. sinensis TaxID=542762 RepID=A0A4V3WNX1_CAMSN|nr:hypothetical protein TEA_000743 [Camellia sinensis var. sinensis]